MVSYGAKSNGGRGIFKIDYVFPSVIPGSSVAVRRDFPSSKSVVAGPVDFIGMVFFKINGKHTPVLLYLLVMELFFIQAGIF